MFGDCFFFKNSSSVSENNYDYDQVASLETYVGTGHEYAGIPRYHGQLFCNGDRTVPHVLHKLANSPSRLLDPIKM